MLHASVAQVSMDLITHDEHTMLVCHMSHTLQLLIAPHTPTGIVWVTEEQHLGLRESLIQSIPVDIEALVTYQQRRLHQLTVAPADDVGIKDSLEIFQAAVTAGKSP